MVNAGFGLVTCDGANTTLTPVVVLHHATASTNQNIKTGVPLDKLTDQYVSFLGTRLYSTWHARDMAFTEGVLDLAELSSSFRASAHWHCEAPL